MDVREKLVELLKDAQVASVDKCHTYKACNSCPNNGQGILCRVPFSVDHLIAHGVTVIPPEGIGEMSDGYHTFNELYHHRAVLFSVICNAMPDKAWKSKRHDTGDMYDGMFIVGIETNHGQATYHYDVDPYWDMFNVPELEYAPKWDGHTPQEAINRIANGVTVQEWISVKDRLPDWRDGKVLVFTKYGFSICERTVNNRWQGQHANWITHWAYLPQPPKGE